MPPRNYYDVDFSHVPLEFATPFAGLFMADGYVGIMKYRAKRTGRWSYTLRVSIGLRVDDRLVLDRALEHFGGSINLNRRKNAHNQYHWSLNGMPRAKAFLELALLLAGPLGSRKLRDCKLALEYCSWRLSRPHYLTDEDRATQEDFYQRMKDIKICKGA